MMLKRTLVFWWKVIQDATSLWLERNAFSYAGSLAFYTLFSLAPTVIIAVTVIGVVLGEEAAHGQIVAQLQGTLGTEAALAIEQAVARIPDFCIREELKTGKLVRAGDESWDIPLEIRLYRCSLVHKPGVERLWRQMMKLPRDFLQA